MKSFLNKHLVAGFAVGALLSAPLSGMAATPSGKPELLFDKTGQWHSGAMEES